MKLGILLFFAFPIFAFSYECLAPIDMMDGIIIFVPADCNDIISPVNPYQYGIFPTDLDLDLSLEDYLTLVSELGIFAGLMFWKILFNGGLR